MDVIYSINRVPIRITSERWFHIVENHDDLAGYYDEILDTVENPDAVLCGYRGSLIAGKQLGRKRCLLVSYREVTVSDGFIITAYFSDKLDWKKAIWKK